MQISCDPVGILSDEFYDAVQTQECSAFRMFGTSPRIATLAAHSACLDRSSSIATDVAVKSSISFENMTDVRQDVISGNVAAILLQLFITSNYETYITIILYT